MSDSRRPRRVAETIRKHIAEALTRELFDPRLAGLAVTQVDIGLDLSLAKVHVRAMTGSRTDEQQRQILKALSGAAPALRRGLGAQLGIKKTPELAFSYDTGQDALDRVEELLGEIARESSARGE